MHDADGVQMLQRRRALQPPRLESAPQQQRVRRQQRVHLQQHVHAVLQRRLVRPAAAAQELVLQRVPARHAERRARAAAGRADLHSSIRM